MQDYKKDMYKKYWTAAYLLTSMEALQIQS